MGLLITNTMSLKGCAQKLLLRIENRQKSRKHLQIKQKLLVFSEQWTDHPTVQNPTVQSN